jgi:hypothetical protein
MKESSSGQADQAIERVLELSADAHITRRKTPKVPQFDGSDRSLRQRTGDSHSTSTARGILLNNRSIRIVRAECSGQLNSKHPQRRSVLAVDKAP